MQFTLIDRITAITPNSSITAVKALSMAEDYLKDHFPRFPVMPGVLMLEAMFQTSAWLVRESEDFKNTIVLLKEARNVKYADFVSPGNILEITAEIIKQDENTTTLKTRGTINSSGENAVSAKLTLERYSLSDKNVENQAVDNFIRGKMREQYSQLFRPDIAEATRS
ncbi:MAG: 3-hydroxyacyl-[acyl-carrier-protein] dehydratase [Pirellulaceae bacterium]|jgi:3-hydroxyacyl-[acyl-carrier-protein] dehydratase